MIQVCRGEKLQVKKGFTNPAPKPRTVGCTSICYCYAETGCTRRRKAGKNEWKLLSSTFSTTVIPKLKPGKARDPPAGVLLPIATAALKLKTGRRHRTLERVSLQLDSDSTQEYKK